MNLFIYQLIFFILIYIQSTHNYRIGAPPEACPTMIPGHGVNSQQCSTKYIIQSDKSQYYTNDTILITVNGSTSSDTFKGVLIIAKTEISEQIIGSWSIVSSTLRTFACGGIANTTGVTHVSNTDKTSVQAIWSPPSTIYAENTIIKATVVTSFTVFYVDCFSIRLINRQAAQSNGTAVITSSSSGTTVATTTAPQTNNVGVNISWTYSNGVTTVKMRITNLKTSQWVALGLSLDENMGDDHVFVCKRLANDAVTVGRYINPGGHAPPKPVTTSEGGTFTPTLKKLDNGVADCEFTLSNFGASKRQQRDIPSLSQSTSYHPLIAIGNLDNSNGLIRHASRISLSRTVLLNQQEVITYNADSSTSNRISLVKAHGIIMIFTWIVFVSTGILIARHFKPLLPNKKVYGKAIWFVIHRTIMTTAVILTITAFILILVYKNGKWVPQDTSLEFAHSIIGIIIICFAIIQPIMALFRCKPDAEYRFIFNYAHRTVGLTAFILSIVAIFLALFFTEFTFEMNNPWGILVVWTCWIPVIFFIFWLIEYYFRKNRSNKENTDSYDLGNTEQKNEEKQMINNVKQDRIKLGFLMIHILVAFGLALTLAIFLGQQLKKIN